MWGVGAMQGGLIGGYQCYKYRCIQCVKYRSLQQVLLGVEALDSLKNFTLKKSTRITQQRAIYKYSSLRITCSLIYPKVVP